MPDYYLKKEKIEFYLRFINHCYALNVNLINNKHKLYINYLNNESRFHFTCRVSLIFA